MRVILTGFVQVLFGLIVVQGCGASRASSDYISLSPRTSLIFVSDFDRPVKSEDDASLYFTQWLSDSTDFNTLVNRIESNQPGPDYFDFTLTTAIKILDRESGIIGYQKYRLMQDGRLYGYYYSK